MTNEEITKKDLDGNLLLVGDRILVQLKEIKEHTKTEGGLLIPHNELMETDGGKITTRPSKQKYYAEGEVVNASTYALKKLEEQGVMLSIGDEVLVAKHILNNDSFYFYENRSMPVQDFKGLISIPHTLIEAITTTKQ